MIVSENIDATTNVFVQVLNDSVSLLKNEAAVDAKKYLASGGTKLEGLVLEALRTSAEGTECDGSIRLASGQKFPDIVLEAGGLGVEVKSTTQDHWITTGNSVLESTRVPDIKKIFLMFGKLVDPVDFKARPYEECLKEVLVTHYPRYQIDMDLPDGQTIFDKIGKSYDEVRSLPEPVAPMIEYYSSKLQPGESLWWTGRHNVQDQCSPVTIRELSSLGSKERNEIVASSFVLFPQLFSRRQDKFHEVLMWLLRRGYICGNIRDLYTAGGRWKYRTGKKGTIELPQIVKRLFEYKNLFLEFLFTIDCDELEYAWKTKVSLCVDRLAVWHSLLAEYGCDNAILKVIREGFIR